MESISVRIGGANGDGIDSAGIMLARIFKRLGYWIFAFRGYQSVIRGGVVWHQVRLSNEKLYTYGNEIDVLVALTKEAIEESISHVRKGGFLIYDSSLPKVQESNEINILPIPITELAIKAGGSIYRNTVAIGAVCKLLGIDSNLAKDVLLARFKKNPAVLESNSKAFDLGYSSLGDGKRSIIKLPKPGNAGKYLLNGNTALAIGAYAAGCKFYAAYPMTPASSIMEWFAKYEGLGVFFKQTEDEIAAINMVIGASSAGVRAMCGTSGGGFSLMVEALGLAGMIEVPIVVVESQRTGPSTGLPTKTEQGDLLFVTHASQGDFPRIVLAPRNIEECFYLGAQAFNLAEKYQCPVIILLDLFLSEHVESVDIDPSKINIDRGKIQKEPIKDFKRYQITEDGISPRSIPGTKGLAFVAASDEHDEYGNLISDVLVGLPEYAELRKKMHEKRLRKLETMLKNNDIELPMVMNEGADIFIVTFGSSTESSIEALELLKERGINAGLIAFSYLHPMDGEKIKKILEGKRLVDVECNATGQLAKLIAMNTGIIIKDKVLRYDGEAITSKEIADGVEKYYRGV
ncbi:MAG: 2-oxoacid:acceptor oxidoreductase subunit alpha [Candidatus Micrarchaeia archaeon]